jgi:hypothetical protein
MMPDPYTTTWKPFKSAPDVGDYLVFIPGDGMHVCQSRKIMNGKIMKTVGGIMLWDRTPPTHWAPLPQAPVC